jgi:uncharacterized protein (TIGR02147 family)
MIINIFNFDCYKTYLKEYIQTRPYAGRGLRSQMARHLDIHTAYMSQVINNHAHFTLEQGFKLAEFLALTQTETDFLILLIQKDRSGTKDLEDYFKKRIARSIEEQKSLKNRLEVETELSQEHRQVYYSCWHYIAIHAFLATKSYSSPDQISKKLHVPLSKVNEVIEFLVEIGLIKKENNRYGLTSVDFHLPSSSPLIAKHHTNWRMKAIQALDTIEEETSLHYSGVISVSKPDADKIKSILIKSLQDARKIIKKSQAEEVYCYTIDFFGLL